MIRLHPFLAQIWAFVLLSRPLFLAGGFLFHGLGVAVALHTGGVVDLSVLLWTQITITAGQAMTHFANEYFDRAGDRANTTPTPWSGGSRVLPKGILPDWVALAAALLCGGAALAAGAVLLRLRPDVAGMLAGVILAGLTLAWFYSAPPLRLHSRGLGELTVAVVTPGLTPLLGFLAQSPPGAAPVHWSLLLGSVLPILCIQIPLMLGVEWPDAAADAAAGKRTLAVRLGSAGSARLHNALLILAYWTVVVGLLLGVPWPVCAAMTATLPLALWQMHQVNTGAHTDPQRWTGLAFGNIALLNAVAGVAVVAYLWESGFVSWLLG